MSSSLAHALEDLAEGTEVRVYLTNGAHFTGRLNNVYGDCITLFCGEADGKANYVEIQLPHVVAISWADPV